MTAAYVKSEGKKARLVLDYPTENGVKKFMVDVPRFLNRLLGLPIAHQALLYNLFFHLMEDDIRQAKMEGKFDRVSGDVSLIQCIAPPFRPSLHQREAHTLTLPPPHRASLNSKAEA